MRSILTFLLLLLALPVQATVIANSIAEFSGVQGQDGWSYGIFDQGGDSANLTPYTVGGFQAFDLFNGNWEASDALVGADNNDFLSLNANGGHPTGLGPGGQDRVIWAVRRYESEVDGLISIAFDLRKENVVNDRGGGITGRIFIDGVPVFEQFIDNIDGAGVQDTIAATISVGSVIDIAIDPLGIQPAAGSDGLFSARADGSHFSAVISEVPEPATGLLAAPLLFGLAARRRRWGQTRSASGTTRP